MRHYAKLLRATPTASLMLVAMARAAVAGSPEGLPLLHEGSARTAFASRVYKTCLERQRKHPENTILTPPELGQYCLCYGRAIADIVNAEEFEAITLGGAAPASFLQKTALSAKLCRAQDAAGHPR